MFLLADFAALIGILWFYIRFGIISNLRTRGWQDRLTRPSREEVEAEWNVRLPVVLDDFYRSGGIVTQSEFYLVHPGGTGSPRWYIWGFIPLAKPDIAEWLKVTGVPGIPLASGGEEGIYYVPFEALRRGDSPVFRREPGKRDTEVASSVEEFVRFRPVEVDDAEDDESMS